MGDGMSATWSMSWESVVETSREVRVDFASNVFVENEVLVLNGEDFSNSRLGVLECLSKNEGAGKSALVRSIKYAVRLLHEHIESCEMFLLIGDSTWQPDTRIIRYGGAMGRLKRRGIDFGVDPDAVGIVDRDGCGIKFFSLIKMHDKSIDLLPLAMQAGSISYLIFVSSNEDWLPVLNEELLGDWSKDSAMISAVIESGGVVMRRVGFFDDPYVGVQGLAETSFIDKMSGKFLG